MLLGLVVPSGGAIRIFGEDMLADRYRALGRMNFSSPCVELPQSLTVRENLTVYAHLYGARDIPGRLRQIAAELELDSLMGRVYRSLSAGQRTRVTLAKALLNEPELILLGEPTVSLDPDTADSVRGLLLGYQQRTGATLLLTSHNVTEVERSIYSMGLPLIAFFAVLMMFGWAVPSRYVFEGMRAVLIEHRFDWSLVLHQPRDGRAVHRYRHWHIHAHLPDGPPPRPVAPGRRIGRRGSARIARGLDTCPIRRLSLCCNGRASAKARRNHGDHYFLGCRRRNRFLSHQHVQRAGDGTQPVQERLRADRCAAAAPL
jgi:ABC-type transport system involved in cytochrome c biogenesis ATPase subunit